ncbi:hypothetical protein ACIP98_37670 [Streptomyces sp. NPDC088354]|uniref:hypothetical protein n=1 Tax=Streptomyces sp. NPDC088354 TaxID=3365856 RepID=UPI0037F7646E
MTEIGKYETGTYPSSVAIAPNGMVAAGITIGGPSDIYLYQPGSTASFRKIALSWPRWDLLARGVTWAPDGNRLFATRFPYSGEVILDVVTDVRKASGDITLQGPETTPLGQRLTVHGTLTSLVPLPAHARVTVSRDYEPIATARVAADGTFKFVDRPPLPSTHLYSVTYAGDSDHVSGSAEIVIEVVG